MYKSLLEKPARMTFMEANGTTFPISSLTSKKMGSAVVLSNTLFQARTEMLEVVGLVISIVTMYLLPGLVTKPISCAEVHCSSDETQSSRLKALSNRNMVWELRLTIVVTSYRDIDFEQWRHRQASNLQSQIRRKSFRTYGQTQPKPRTYKESPSQYIAAGPLQPAFGLLRRFIADRAFLRFYRIGAKF